MVSIHKSAPMKIQEVVEDPAWIFLICQGYLMSHNHNFINIYGPNNDAYFYNNLFLQMSYIHTFLDKYTMADFNCTLDPQINRSSGVDNTHMDQKNITGFY